MAYVADAYAVWKSTPGVLKWLDRATRGAAGLGPAAAKGKQWKPRI